MEVDAENDLVSSISTKYDGKRGKKAKDAHRGDHLKQIEGGHNEY